MYPLQYNIYSVSILCFLVSNCNFYEHLNFGNVIVQRGEACFSEVGIPFPIQ